MRKIILPVFILVATLTSAQSDTSLLLRAFPITDYMVDLNDTVKLVQVHLPDDVMLKEKQLGLVRGVYDGAVKDTVQKGYGRCQLIKGNYYYFSVGNNSSGSPLKAGDLLYTFMEKGDIYDGWAPKIAGHFIRLLNVQGTPFYDRYDVFRYWSGENDRQLLDSMVQDIQFTGNYFIENEPSMNQHIKSGYYQGRPLLNVMRECRVEDLQEFLSYILARPRLYAGNEWKISEIFATWLSSGAPMVNR